MLPCSFFTFLLLNHMYLLCMQSLVSDEPVFSLFELNIPPLHRYIYDHIRNFDLNSNGV